MSRMKNRDEMILMKTAAMKIVRDKDCTKCMPIGSALVIDGATELINKIATTCSICSNVFRIMKCFA